MSDNTHRLLERRLEQMRLRADHSSRSVTPDVLSSATPRRPSLRDIPAYPRNGRRAQRWAQPEAPSSTLRLFPAMERNTLRDRVYHYDGQGPGVRLEIRPAERLLLDTEPSYLPPAPPSLREEPDPKDAQPRSSPISKLPPEILIAIFRELSNLTYSLQRHAVTHWQVVTRVSYLWRTIAVSDPVLWTTIPLDASSEAVSLYCKRSNELPLRILFSPKSIFQSDKQRAIQCNAWRIKALLQVESRNAPLPFFRFGLHTKYLEKFPRSFFDHTQITMPLLEEVHVHPNGSGFAIDEALDEDSALIRAPNLRRLSILDGRCGMSWQGIRIPQLRSLDIGMIMASSLFYKNFLKCIRASPLLEEFRVGYCQFTTIEETPTREDIPIELSHLRRLCLGGEARGILIILGSLVFDPHTTIIELDVDDQTIDPLLALPLGLGGNGSNTFAWVKLVGDSLIGIEAGFDYNNADRPLTLRFRLPDPPRLTSFNGIPTYSPMACLSTTIRDMCTVLKLGGVRMLSLNLHPIERLQYNKFHWEYGWLTDVEVVEVAYPHHEPLCEALLKPVDRRFGSGVFLPSLKCIRVRPAGTNMPSKADIYASLDRRLKMIFRRGTAHVRIVTAINTDATAFMIRIEPSSDGSARDFVI